MEFFEKIICFRFVYGERTIASYDANTIAATSTDRDFKLNVASGFPGCNFNSNSTHMLLDNFND